MTQDSSSFVSRLRMYVHEVGNPSSFFAADTTFLSYVKRVVRNLGWWDGILCLINDTLLYLCRGRVEIMKYYFFAQPVVGQRILPPGRGANIEVRCVDSDDPVVKQFPNSPEIIQDRFSSGACCFVALKEQKFVGYLWLKRGSRDAEEGYYCRFTPLPAASTAWDFDLYVIADQRSSFVFARLWDEANQFLKDTGVRWTVSDINAFNPLSINSHSRLGAYPVGSATFIWINAQPPYTYVAPLAQAILTDTRPHFHVSWSKQFIPELRVHAEQQKAFSRFRHRSVQQHM